MNEYYNKKTYLELVKKQIAVYERFLESIDLILTKLPENGKRFGTKWFDAINEELKEKEIVVRLCNPYSDSIGIRIDYTNYEYVWEKDWVMPATFSTRFYDSGVMRDKDACIKMLTSFKGLLEQNIKVLNEIKSKIDTFIAKWDEFDKMSKELRGFNMRHIDIPYVGSCPILDE